MDNTPHVAFTVADRSYLATVKKEIHRMAVGAGFEQKKIDQIDLVVAEMGSNLVKHTDGGEILAAIVHINGGTALEMISIDNGPGISEPEKMMQDGMSTAGTLGHGLGSIKRFSDVFELYTQREWGTILLSRVWLVPPKKGKKSWVELRSLMVPKPGETVCGDGCYSYTAEDGTCRLLVADGLGHGKEADK